MMTMKRTMFGSALPVLLFSFSAAAATTYYVAPNGSDSAAGTMAAPWASIAHAQVTMAAGDTVYFRAGTYAYTKGLVACKSTTDTTNAILISQSGKSGAPLNFWAYPGETPIFDFSGMTDLSVNNCRMTGFRITGSWIYLKGLEVTGVRQNNMDNHESWGVWNSGSNNTFELLNTHHNMGPGVFIQNGGNNLVLNCDSHHNYDPMTSNGAGQSADGFGCHISAGNTGNVFRGCRAWWNSDDNYDLINAFAVVTIENSWAWYAGYLPDTMTSVSAGNGNGIKSGGYGTDTSTFPANPPQHVVRNCLSVSNKDAGFYANHHPGPIVYYNNTSYNNHPDFNLLGMNSSGADISVGILRNNIGLAGTVLSNNTLSAIDEADNSWDTALGVTASTADFASVAVTGLDGPRHADGSLPALTNFHLVAGSDLIDKGVNVGLPYVGSAPDLGAFEYGAAGTSGTGGTTGAAGTGGGAGIGGGAGGRGGTSGAGGRAGTSGTAGTTGTAGTAGGAGRGGAAGGVSGTGTAGASGGGSGTGAAGAAGGVSGTGTGGTAVATGVGGSGTGAGGVVGSGTGGTSATGSGGSNAGGAGAPTTDGGSSGCSCDTGGGRGGGNLAVLGMLSLLGLAISRRRAKPDHLSCRRLRSRAIVFASWRRAPFSRE